MDGLPPWVPKTVVEVAAGLRDDAITSDEATLLDRLLRHPAMKAVWGELLRRQRPGQEKYFNPATIDPHSLANHLRAKANKLRALKKPTQLDEIHIAIFELEATQLAKRKTTPFEESEQERALAIFFEKTFEIARDIDPVFSRGAERGAKVGVKSAKTYNRPGADDPWIIERDRGDHRERYLIGCLNIVTRTLFASDLASTIGTVVMVILGSDRQISRDRVRDVIRSRPQRRP